MTKSEDMHECKGCYRHFVKKSSEQWIYDEEDGGCSHYTCPYCNRIDFETIVE